MKKYLLVFFLLLIPFIACDCGDECLEDCQLSCEQSRLRCNGREACLEELKFCDDFCVEECSYYVPVIGTTTRAAESGDV